MEVAAGQSLWFWRMRVSVCMLFPMMASTPFFSEILKRYRLRPAAASPAEAPELASPEDAARLVTREAVPVFRRLRHLGAVYVDGFARALVYSPPYQGCMSRLLPSTFLRPALVVEADGLYVFRHRPGKVRAASRQDLRVARELLAAGEKVGVRLLGYLLVGDGEVWLSLGQEGRVRFHALGEDVTGRPPDGRSRVAPKYRNPDNPEETWSGRGMKAGWLQEKLDAGARLEDFLVGE